MIPAKNGNLRNLSQNLEIHYHSGKNIKKWIQCIDSKNIAVFIGLKQKITNIWQLFISPTSSLPIPNYVNGPLHRAVKGVDLSSSSHSFGYCYEAVED
jgi:aspartate/methionine/tyrosine aminotransferase